MEMEPVVERAPEYHGWRIRSADQPAGQGMVVTDNWLRSFGFIRPSKGNIDRIIRATQACMMGMTAEQPMLQGDPEMKRNVPRTKVDHEREAKVFGDAEGIAIGEGHAI